VSPESLSSAVALAALVAVAAFSARRLVMIAAALAPRRRVARLADGELPGVTLIVPARNEAARCDALFAALTRLEYPHGRLHYILVSDGSTDGTGARFRRFAASTHRVQVVELAENVGKASALNAALALATTELVVVSDADLRPEPSCIRLLASALADPDVGAAAALLRPENGGAGVVARYSALDYLVSQGLTSAAKDRLALDPSTLGAAAFRRTALEEIGGFRTAGGEDVDAALALGRSGWRTRFVPEARADMTVAATVPDYWRQHIRWARGTFDAGRRRRWSRRQSVARHAERWAVVAGYSDRVAFLALAVLALFGRAPLWAPAAYLAIAGAGVAAAVLRNGQLRDLPRYAFAAALMFPVDVAASVAALATHTLRRRRTWHSPRDATA
jgi:cellulose synthase/poly-beta-1,6-N-acetylglucosamine synthase-like glycosyltransferase